MTYTLTTTDQDKVNWYAAQFKKLVTDGKNYHAIDQFSIIGAVGLESDKPAITFRIVTLPVNPKGYFKQYIVGSVEGVFNGFDRFDETAITQKEEN